MVEHLEVLSKKNEWQHFGAVNICIQIITSARTPGWSYDEMWVGELLIFFPSTIESF
jgi:hypothetical protein